MAKVEVFRYRAWDLGKDEYAEFSRFATRAWIDRQRIGQDKLAPIEASRIEIDESFLDADGRTIENFDPKAPKRPD